MANGDSIFGGTGLVQPLVMGPSDFVSASDAALFVSSAEQILGTRKGELRWDPSLGVDFSRFLDDPIDGENEANILREARQGLERHDPRLRVTSVAIQHDLVRQRVDAVVTFDVVRAPGAEAVLTGLQAQVRVQ